MPGKFDQSFVSAPVARFTKHFISKLTFRPFSLTCMVSYNILWQEIIQGNTEKIAVPWVALLMNLRHFFFLSGLRFLIFLLTCGISATRSFILVGFFNIEEKRTV